MSPRSSPLPGTLELLILKALSLDALHGVGLMQRIEQITAGAMRVSYGSLFPGRLRAVVRRLVGRRRVDQTLDDELQSCVEIPTERHVAAGLTPLDARRRALVELGGVEQVNSSSCCSASSREIRAPSEMP